MRGQPGHNAQPHARLKPSFQGIDAWITSELNEALVCKLRVSLMSLSDIFDIPSMGVLYNQALADVRSTRAGIKCVYCNWSSSCQDMLGCALEVPRIFMTISKPLCKSFVGCVD